MPHLDELGWLVQERKVIDFKGSASTHLGNFFNDEVVPVSQNSLEMRSSDLLQRGDSGILNYMTVWKPNRVASKDLLQRMGWSMIAMSMTRSNPMEISTTHVAQMNILIWNCRGALNLDFKRRVIKMAVNHFPSIMVITETRVGDMVLKTGIVKEPEKELITGFMVEPRSNQ